MPPSKSEILCAMIHRECGRFTLNLPVRHRIHCCQGIRADIIQDKLRSELPAFNETNQPDILTLPSESVLQHKKTSISRIIRVGRSPRFIALHTHQSHRS